MLSLQYRINFNEFLIFSLRNSPSLCVLHLTPECTHYSYSLDENVSESLTGKQANFKRKDGEGNKDRLQSGLRCQLWPSGARCTREGELTWNPAEVMDITPTTSPELRLMLQLQRLEGWSFSLQTRPDDKSCHGDQKSPHYQEHRIIEPKSSFLVCLHIF